MAQHLVCSKCGTRNSEETEGRRRGALPGLQQGLRAIGDPDKIPENINFAAQELLEAPDDQRPVLLENIAKALTRRLLTDNPSIGIREVSDWVTAFINAVRVRIE